MSNIFFKKEPYKFKEYTKPIKFKERNEVFARQNRVDREIAFRNRTEPPDALSKNINYKIVDPDEKVFEMGKYSDRPDCFKVKTYEQYPNTEVEHPWFSPSKFRRTYMSTGNLQGTLNMMSPVNSLLVSSDNFQNNDKDKNKNGKPANDESSKNQSSIYKNIKLSSYGFHYWDPKKLPDDKDSFWPPLADKFKLRKVKSVPEFETFKTNKNYDKNRRATTKSIKYTKEEQEERMTNYIRNYNKKHDYEYDLNPRPEFQDWQINPLNEKRFVDFKKPETHLSQYTRSTSAEFHNLCARDRDLSPKSQSPRKLCYDYQFEFPKRQLTNVECGFEHYTPRNPYPKKRVLESPELNKLDFADKKQSSRIPVKNAVHMTKTAARDDRMYNSGEWYRNCRDEINRDKRRIQYEEKLARRNDIKDI